MAVLADEDRAEIWAEFMREACRLGISLPVLKAELRSAFNGADDYMNTNAAAMNTAIPQPARGALSAEAKALIYKFVIDRRYLKGV